MRTRTRFIAVGLAMAALGCAATPRPGAGEGRGRVLVCHKGKTLEVAAPAVDAHLRHGDSRGPCR